MLQTDDAVAAALTNRKAQGRPRPYLIFGLALLPFLALAVWRAFDGNGVRSDDFGQYLMHAKALAEGRPYGDTGYIYSKFARFVGPKLAPPGLPFTLAPVMAVFGNNMAVFKTVMILFGVAYVAFAGHYFARFAGWRLGLAVALLCALSPDMVHGASQILTDLPTAALIWALIYLIDCPGDFTIRKILAVTLLGAYIVAFRSTGIVLGPALLFYGALQFSQHRFRPFIPLLIWGIGLGLLGLVANIGATAVITVRPRSLLHWIFVGKIPLDNMLIYAEGVLTSHLYPFPWSTANHLFHAFTVGLTIVGLAAWLRPNFRRFSVVFGASYMLFLLLLPFAQSRYLWPLYPFFVFGMLNGVRVIVERLRVTDRIAKTSAVAFAIALVPPAALNVINDPHPVDLADIPEAREVFDYFEGRAPDADLRVTFFKPRTLAWVTGIAAMGPPRGEPHCIVGELTHQRITHVVTGSLDGTRVSPLRNAISHHPERFTKVLENRIFAVYEFRPGTDSMLYAQNRECRRE